VCATFCCTLARTMYLCVCLCVCVCVCVYVCVCVCVCVWEREREWLSYSIYHIIKWHYQVHLCKGLAVCLLWGWILKDYSHRIHALNGWLITSRNCHFFNSQICFLLFCSMNTSKHSTVSYFYIVFWTLLSVSSRLLIDLLAVKSWLTLCLPHPPVYFL